MYIQKFENEDQWLMARRGKITGSRLADVLPPKRGEGKKIGYYELIAERLGIAADGENPMERGHRLEKEAIEHFEKQYGKKVDTSLVMWVYEENESIAVSPDGVIGKTEAVEVKCLSSARHIEALLTQKIPSEYKYQVLQYFIVNDSLKKLHFVFYDPRLIAKPFFVMEVKRADVKEEIDAIKQAQMEIIQDVERIVNELSGF